MGKKLEGSDSSVFGSIESTQAFLNTLAEVIKNAQKEAGELRYRAIQDDTCGTSRAAEAWELVIFKLKMLDRNITKSKVIMNDLRLLRRMLCGER